MHLQQQHRPRLLLHRRLNTMDVLTQRIYRNTPPIYTIERLGLNIERLGLSVGP
jgi:hypothetical protein